VTISFGLRNVVDTGKALREMLRVTKPGGRLVICEFSEVSNPVLRGLYNFYLRNFMPLFSRLAAKNAPAYNYLSESIQAWPKQEALAALITDAGWERVSYQNLTFGVVALHIAFKAAK